MKVVAYKSKDGRLHESEKNCIIADIQLAVQSRGGSARTSSIEFLVEDGIFELMCELHKLSV